VVNNVATVYAISQAMENIPLTQKILTVTGEVKKPTVLCVPVGTSYAECIKLAGGTNSSTYFVVNGGPMMGKPLTMEEADRAVVTKTTSGILVLPADGYHATTNTIQLKRMLKQASVACIQCTNCTQLCPRHMLGHPLRPHMIMRKMATCGDVRQMLDDPDIRNAQLCCECGICETYACPMGLFPRKINAMLKGELGKAGIRYQAPEQIWTASPLREGRKAPSDKVAARVGVRKYYNYEITDIITATVSRVEIPVKMHIGAPSVATVSVGDYVRLGQVIAEPPEGALGAFVHASIDGRVTVVGERIVIEKE
jgi:Na+-translocating ferredoxin:NAD+ oxidoreductase RnfC subunit